MSLPDLLLNDHHLTRTIPSPESLASLPKLEKLDASNNGNERLLVYEYMPQGNLGQHLSEWQELGYAPLAWKKRVTMTLDVAREVENLQSLAQSSFIHKDLKPSNILLGDDMRAKVTDFGLVKKAPDGNYSLEIRLTGTYGYLSLKYAGKHQQY